MSEEQVGRVKEFLRTHTYMGPLGFVRKTVNETQKNSSVSTDDESVKIETINGQLYWNGKKLY